MIINQMKKPEAETEAKAAAAESQEVLYSCHPVQNFTIGGFTFERGLLRLTKPADIEAFEALHENLPDGERHRIKRIAVEKAAEIAQGFVESSKSTGVATSETPIQ